MNTTLVALLLAVSNPLAASSFQGVILKGVIVENEAGGPPIANVQISAQDGANAVLSLSNGTFVLEVAKQPGERVRLILQRPGMVVVNDWEREFNLPRPENAALLTFLLCRKIDLPEMKRRYYRVDVVDRTAQSYQKKLEDSEAKRSAAEAEKERLRTLLDQAIKAAAGEKEARVKVEELSGSDLHWVSSVNRSTEAMALNTAATLFRRENRPEEARKFYDEALKVSRKLAQQDPNTYLSDVADTLNNRGDLLSEQNRLDEAWKDFNEAVEISRDLTKKNPTYQLYLAIALTNLGAVYHKQNRIEDERAALEEALGLYHGLAQLNPIHRPNEAETLIKLGILNLDKNQEEEKRKAFTKALSIYQTLERENPREYAQEIESTIELLEVSFTETLESHRRTGESGSSISSKNSGDSEQSRQTKSRPA